MGARLPAWDLLTISKFLVQDVDGTAPDVAVLKLGLWPTGLGEEVMWTEAVVDAGHMVPEERSVIDCKGPETWRGNIRPMDGAVKHHGSRN
jgi:hypothetical protein